MLTRSTLRLNWSQRHRPTGRSRWFIGVAFSPSCSKAWPLSGECRNGGLTLWDALLHRLDDLLRSPMSTLSCFHIPRLSIIATRCRWEARPAGLTQIGASRSGLEGSYRTEFLDDGTVTRVASYSNFSGVMGRSRMRFPVAW